VSFQSSEFLINTILPLRSRPCKSSFVSMFWSFMFTFADVYHIICVYIHLNVSERHNKYIIIYLCVCACVCVMVCVCTHMLFCSSFCLFV